MCYFGTFDFIIVPNWYNVNMNNKEFQKMCKNIKDFREERGLSQGEISKILNINRTVYNRYENGKRAIPIEILWQLADFYKISIDLLIGRID